MVRLIVFLIRKRLGLGKYELFRFDNQKSKYDCYYFSTHGVKKVRSDGFISPSNVSLNWLLNKECNIIPVEWCEAASIIFRMQTYVARNFKDACREE